jgi:hypothetical protein
MRSKPEKASSVTSYNSGCAGCVASTANPESARPPSVLQDTAFRQGSDMGLARVHLYGTLFSNVPDYNGSQILVDRIVIEE